MNDEKDIKTLKPVRNVCMTIGELPTSYLETMTYYEMLLWFTKYLSETIVPTFNENMIAIDSKLQEQDEEIADAIDYMKTNIVSTLSELFHEAVINGDLTADLTETYNSATEELTLSIVATESESV